MDQLSGHGRVAIKIFEDFGGTLCKDFITGHEPVSTLGLEPVSIVHYTNLDPVSSSPPKTNYLHNECQVNWSVVFAVFSYKIMDPVSAALPQNLQRSS